MATPKAFTIFAHQTSITGIAPKFMLRCSPRFNPVVFSYIHLKNCWIQNRIGYLSVINWNFLQFLHVIAHDQCWIAVAEIGFEPMILSLWDLRVTRLLHPAIYYLLTYDNFHILKNPKYIENIRIIPCRTRASWISHTVIISYQYSSLRFIIDWWS